MRVFYVMETGIRYRDLDLASVCVCCAWVVVGRFGNGLAVGGRPESDQRSSILVYHCLQHAPNGSVGERLISLPNNIYIQNTDVGRQKGKFELCLDCQSIYSKSSPEFVWALLS